GPLLSSSPARPLLTHYDDAAQTRIELSGATLANWAAKTANWLVEEFDVEGGDPVCVRLAAHWQTAGVLLGAVWAGAHAVTGPQACCSAPSGPAPTWSPIRRTPASCSCRRASTTSPLRRPSSPWTRSAAACRVVWQRPLWTTWPSLACAGMSSRRWNPYPTTP